MNKEQRSHNSVLCLVSAKQQKKNRIWALVVARKMADCKGRCEGIRPSGLRCKATHSLSGHHKILRSNGGDDTYENCALLCQKCQFPDGYHKKGEILPPPVRVLNLKG